MLHPSSLLLKDENPDHSPTSTAMLQYVLFFNDAFMYNI